MIYLLDANSFIEAKHKHYRMRVVPGYWEWLLSQQPGHQIQSIVPVYKELTSNSADKDDLHLWAENHKNLFIGVDGVDTQQAFSEVANYLAEHQWYSDAEKARFLAGADPWLIAAAKALGATLVTHEVPVPDNSKKVKIPNIAREFSVDYMDVFDLLELTGCELLLKL